MKRLFLALSLGIVGSSLALWALDVRFYKTGHDFITDGTLSSVDWYERGLAAMSDYPNYNNWGLRGIDGKDPVSAKYWEHFQNYEYIAPDKMVIHLSLSLPWPIGTISMLLKFKIDDSNLRRDLLLMNMIEPPFGVEKASLSLAARDSVKDAGAKDIQFRISLRLAPLIEALLSVESLGAHMREVVGAISGNLETYCHQPAVIK